MPTEEHTKYSRNIYVRQMKIIVSKVSLIGLFNKDRQKLLENEKLKIFH